MTAYVSVTLFVHTWSEKALGFCHPEAESYTEGVGSLGPIWIAKYHIRNHDQLSDYTRPEYRQVEIEIPVWLAENKALDPYCEELDR